MCKITREEFFGDSIVVWCATILLVKLFSAFTSRAKRRAKYLQVRDDVLESARASYKADPEKKQTAEREGYHADPEKKRSAKRERYHRLEVSPTFLCRTFHTNYHVYFGRTAALRH